MLSYLELAYGYDYDHTLKEELIIVKKQKPLVWFLAFVLITFTVSSALLFWEFDECFSQFTDWTMWLTFI